MHKQAIVATAAALTLASCGGSSPLTRAELAKQANAICTQRTQQVAALRKHNARDIRALITAAVPVQAKAVKDFSALKPPASAKATYDRFISSQQAQLAQIKRAAAGQRDRGDFDIHGLQRIEAQLGFSACR